jgi:hypothetical protein
METFVVVAAAACCALVEWGLRRQAGLHRAALISACLWFVSGGMAMAWPGWWAVRGVSSPESADDFAPLVNGQLKTLFLGAVREIDVYLPGGAGSVAWAMADRFDQAGIGEAADDFAPSTLGQLKYLGSLIYRRLIDEGVVRGFPWEVDAGGEEEDLTGGAAGVDLAWDGLGGWAGGVGGVDDVVDDVVKGWGGGAIPVFAEDFALANIGQAKFVFSFDLSADADGNGVPDLADQAWYLKASAEGFLWIWPGSLDSDGDGFPDWAEMSERRSSPWDYFNGERPVLEWEMPLEGAEDLSLTGRGTGYLRSAGVTGGRFSREVRVMVRHADGRPWGGAPLGLRMYRWDGAGEIAATVREVTGDRDAFGVGALSTRMSANESGEVAFRFSFPEDAVYAVGWEVAAGRAVVSGQRAEAGGGIGEGRWEVERRLILKDGVARYTVRVRDGSGNPVPFADMRMEVDRAIGMRFFEGRTDVHGNFECEFSVLPRKDRCGRDHYGVQVSVACGEAKGRDFAGEEPPDVVSINMAGRGVVLELLQPAAEDWVDGGVWEFQAFYRVEIGGEYDPCTGETTPPDGVVKPFIKRVSGKVWNGFGEAAELEDIGSGRELGDRMVRFRFLEPVRWEWEGENWMQMDARLEVQVEGGRTEVIGDYSAGAVRFPFHPMGFDCEVVHMLSGHPWDWVRFTRSSWRVSGGWRLREGSDEVGIFEDPEDLASPFYAQGSGDAVVELEVGGQVVWEKPIHVLGVVPRLEWGALPAKVAEMSTMDRIAGVTFHHSSNSGDGPMEMQRIQRMHMKVGWPYCFRFKERFSDIGYHFVLDRGGRLYQGRDLEGSPGRVYGPFTVGSHVQGANTVAGIGVCMMADYEGPEVFTRERQGLLEGALTGIARRYGVDAATILGHQERAMNGTDCPGHTPMLRTIEIRKNVEKNLK